MAVNMNHSFQQLNTPCLLLDESRLNNNIQRIKDKANSHGVRLRPHAKTAKSAAILERFNGTDTPLTVSTLKEAEYFSDKGFNQLMYAVCLSPDKIPRVASLLKQQVDITVIIDSLTMAAAIAQYAQEHEVRFSVAIEIDCDGHRAGLLPEDPVLIELARQLTNEHGIDFWGLMTHGGGSYDCQHWEQVKAHALLERSALLLAKDRLKDSNIECNNLSLGSTPTVVAADDFSGVNEIRPGVFVFFDLFQAQLGSCKESDIALSVLATVTSHKPESNRIFIDAGGLALSKDRSTSGQRCDYGYGKIVKLDGSDFAQNIVVTEVNQEHGVVQLPAGVAISEFPIGSRVRVLPNHSCMTAAAYPGYYLFNDTDQLQWVERCNGW